jgi:stage II sporulation protein M
VGGVELSHRFKGFWANSLKYNWPAYVIILFVFALGLTTGSLEVYKLQAGELQELSIYLDRFMDQAALIETEPAAAVKSVLYNDLILIAAIYFLGLTIIGIPVILILIFTRGFVLGFSIVFLGWQKTSRE